MTKTITAIPEISGKRTTGYKRLWQTPRENVVTIPAPTAGDVATPVTMDTLGVFYEIPLDPEAGAYLSTAPADGEGATGDMYTLTYFVAGRSAAQRAAAEEQDGVYMIYVGETMDGVKEIIGEVARGLRPKRTMEDDTRSGLAYTAEGKFAHLPYTYSDGTVTE